MLPVTAQVSEPIFNHDPCICSTNWIKMDSVWLGSDQEEQTLGVEGGKQFSALFHQTHSIQQTKGRMIEIDFGTHSDLGCLSSGWV